MIKADINGIFQTPIYRTELTQDFSKKQLSFINNNKLQSQNEKNLNWEPLLLVLL